MTHLCNVRKHWLEWIFKGLVFLPVPWMAILNFFGSSSKYYVLPFAWQIIIQYYNFSALFLGWNNNVVQYVLKMVYIYLYPLEIKCSPYSLQIYLCKFLVRFGLTFRYSSLLYYYRPKTEFFISFCLSYTLLKLKGSTLSSQEVHPDRKPFIQAMVLKSSSNSSVEVVK